MSPPRSIPLGDGGAYHEHLTQDEMTSLDAALFNFQYLLALMRRGDFVERVAPGDEPKWPAQRVVSELEAVRELCRDLGTKSTPVEQVLAEIDARDAEARYHYTRGEQADQ